MRKTVRVAVLFVVVLSVVGCGMKKAPQTPQAVPSPQAVDQHRLEFRMPIDIVMAFNRVCNCAGVTWSCLALGITAQEFEAKTWGPLNYDRNQLALGFGNTPTALLERCLVT